MYPHRYKFGKQKTIMKLPEFQSALDQSDLELEAKAYAVLLWNTGVRKSEAYERVLEDTTVTKDLVVVDFHKRKKGGEEVPPLQIPRAFAGVNEYLVKWISEAAELKPSRKRLYFQVMTAATRVTLKGKVVSVKHRESRIEKARWLFPNIQSTSAWKIVKDLLGKEYYPHYLRLRKLSAVAKNPATKSIIHIKSISGLKSLRAIEAYMGVDAESADEAMRGSE